MHLIQSYLIEEAMAEIIGIKPIETYGQPLNVHTIKTLLKLYETQF